MKNTGRSSGRASSNRNLRPWPPGQSGNPAGRPPGPDCLTDCLRELAGQPSTGGQTHAQRLAVVLWRKAEAGDLRAAALILDRLDGRPAQAARVELAGELRGIEIVGISDAVARADGELAAARRELAARYAVDPPQPNVRLE